MRKIIMLTLALSVGLGLGVLPLSKILDTPKSVFACSEKDKDTSKKGGEGTQKG
jgi:hypothetical protein